MHGRFTPRVVVAAAIVAAGLISNVTPGASAPDRRARATEYPLQVIVVETEPKRPKAGKPFTALIGIVNEETFAPLQSGDVACPARIGSRGVRVIDKSFIDGAGIAGCTWMIPAKAGSKRLVARVEVYSDEGSVTSRVSKVIRR
jgi:hypothetical protein